MTKKQERERARRRWEKQQKTQAARAERRERTKRLAAILGTGIVVAGLVAAGDEPSEARLRQLGVRTFVRPSDDVGHLVATLVEMVARMYDDVGLTTDSATRMARIERLVFGAYDPKAGAVASLFDVVRDPRLPHRTDVRGGILETECGAALRSFFGR